MFLLLQADTGLFCILYMSALIKGILDCFAFYSKHQNQTLRIIKTLLVYSLSKHMMSFATILMVDILDNVHLSSVILSNWQGKLYVSHRLS